MLLERLEGEELDDWLDKLWLDVDCELLLRDVVDCELVDSELGELVLAAAVLVEDKVDCELVLKAAVLVELVLNPIVEELVAELVLSRRVTRFDVEVVWLVVDCELADGLETELKLWLDCELIDRLTVMLEELLDVNPNEVELPELVLNPAVDVLDEDEEL